MSHYSVTVAAGAEDAELAAEAVTMLLTPFDENLMVAQEYDEETQDWHWYNPQAAWDWYQIGGRFSADLPLRAGADSADVLTGERSWTNRDRDLDPTCVDGARIRALDLERKRAAAAEQGGRDWDEYAHVVAGTPQHRPWAEFITRVAEAEAAAPKSWTQLVEQAYDEARRAVSFVEASVGADSPRRRRYDALVRQELDKARAAFQASLSYTLDQARDDYAAQPRIAAIRAHYQGFWLEGPEDIFDHLSRDEFVQRQRLHAIPGFATLTHDARWLAPGRMGWFGMSNDTDESQRAYLDEANDYLDGLDDEMWLVVVDCHI
ncbi:hypothetical protein [Saccharopolyspora taberi]|uniref:Uncharacterized protein n=1 Tax=Saccharopolyspora taberi TaxID=60895 RepID=A0ABN3V828_9PSEU